MTGVEWYEMSYLAYANAVDNFAMILTMASGYLIVAYLVGAKLTRTQVLSVNLVFVPAMLFFMFLAWGFTADGVLARAQASEMVLELGAMPAAMEQPFAILALLVCLGIFVICLKFMRDVRRDSPPA